MNIEARVYPGRWMRKTWKNHKSSNRATCYTTRYIGRHNLGEVVGWATRHPKHSRRARWPDRHRMCPEWRKLPESPVGVLTV